VLYCLLLFTWYLSAQEEEEEDISDATVAARHERVIERMKMRIQHLRPLLPDQALGGGNAGSSGVQLTATSPTLSGGGTPNGRGRGGRARGGRGRARGQGPRTPRANPAPPPVSLAEALGLAPHPAQEIVRDTCTTDL
jgi:hypothetical protein